jgi:UDP-N-acetylglucosamine--N-acetylmuramyl-(pentapeptide) pyrophosphoryl-undecaprenol N-acetylglucosamine transferase
VTRTILLAGGGTAGHVFPALAVARELTARADDVEVVFVGVDDRLEARLVPASGLRAAHHRGGRHPAASLPAAAQVPGALRAGVRSCRRLITERRAVAAVTFGGYVSFPLDRAAFREQLPLVIHEQNSVPGLTNRVASRWADRVAITFPGSAPRFRYQERCVVTGNPVRPDVLELDRDCPPRRGTRGLRARSRPSDGAGVRRQPGGSQHQPSGGRRPRALGRPSQVQLLHATGGVGYTTAPCVGGGPGGPSRRPTVKLVEFIDDMAGAYAAADVVVCRAGATSIAELTVLGLPSVLVPYPHATADHQRENAEPWPAPVAPP